jgi:hypothetical protein
LRNIKQAPNFSQATWTTNPKLEIYRQCHHSLNETTHEKLFIPCDLNEKYDQDEVLINL